MRQLVIEAIRRGCWWGGGRGALHDDFTFMQKAEVNTSEAKTYSPRILFTSPERSHPFIRKGSFHEEKRLRNYKIQLLHYVIFQGVWVNNWFITVQSFLRVLYDQTAHRKT
jgi:hypothetical protein